MARKRWEKAEEDSLFEIIRQAEGGGELYGIIVEQKTNRRLKQDE